MTSQVRCPEGHVWGLDEFDDDPASLDPVAAVACPYCGALCGPDGGPPPSRLPPPSIISSGPAAEPPPPEFPGYQVLDQLGRGGMGVVYKARQIHTDRLVAIKVPDATDLETTCRFGTEAKAAARAPSPNIVQVFEVGQQAGRPFLIMEYCPGGSLADRLDGTPLAPRPVAGLVEALARAVGVAHAAGVVHRDLKPGNVLLVSKPGSDADGPFDPDRWVPKVTDFGLARRLDVDSGQTQTGTILGTPAYMAPEQASGDNRAVGPAADVYALGVLLYELLTGRPPFRGTNPLETLEQIRSADPVPPTRLQPRLPRDLETITLKCLQKEPARRYSSAEALADDLGRFLGGHPILARPASTLERWVKRARRNPAVTGLAAGLCLVLVGAAAYGVWYQVRLQAQRDRALVHFAMSVRSIEEMTEVAEEDLAPEPRSELKRKALLEKALGFYDELRQVETDDPELEWLAARAARRVGDIQRQLGRHAEAREAYALALDRLAPLAAGAATRDKARREQAECHNWLGEIARTRNEPALATESYQRALDIQSELHAGDPDHPGYRQDLSRTRYNRGIVARHTNRLADARVEFDQAAELLTGLSESDPRLRHHRARINLNLGPVLRLSRQLPLADAKCSEAVRLLETLVDEFEHQKVEYRFELAAALINHGLVQLDLNNLRPAAVSVGRARDLLDRLANDYPITPKYKAELANALNSLSAIAYKAGDREAAAGHLARAADVLADLTRRHPESPAYRGDLGIALGNLGRTLAPSRPEEARKHLSRGLGEVAGALRANPDEPHFRESFRSQSRALSRLLVGAGDHDAARQQATDLARPATGPAGSRLAICFLAACVDAVRQSGSTAAAAEVERYAQHAIGLVRAHPPADPAAVLHDPDCEPLRDHAGFVAALRGGKD